MSDISRYEVKEGETWRKPIPQVSFGRPDVLKYEVKLEELEDAKRFASKPNLSLKQALLCRKMIEEYSETQKFGDTHEDDD